MSSTLPPQFLQSVTVAITGASGALYGLKILDLLRARGDTEIHLVISSSGWLTLASESDLSKEEVEAKANVVHSPKSVGNCIASGSYPSMGMVIAPCSMHTLAAVAHGLSNNLITRAADVVLKERRRLVILPRETPLNLAHLRNMVSVTEMGGVVMPPVPALYQRPSSIDAMVTDTAQHALQLLGLPNVQRNEWQGLRSS
ncbi:UbiX family flavin prenyltransferase [Limnobacter parvus]|uniref:Flavin prenyltransferase UbiX n=1 Tax=Limnobacter parvus TaxID=2939690 RepID=A0ABT1XD92_9BURK|nr:UbiX family flavin prenyltransferase [Limnobacter parvus]MCR2745109.1 UbiX family flavin prenyltransferase [Limnobacter parvus]